LPANCGSRQALTFASVRSSANLKEALMTSASTYIKFGCVAAALALGGCASPDFGQTHSRSSFEFGAPPRYAPKPPAKAPPAKAAAPANSCAAPATAEQRLLCHGYFPKGGAQ
jgi:hypothetical protein